MSTHKRIDIICIVSAAVAVVAAVFLMYGKRSDAETVMSGEVDSGMFTENDLDAGWDTAFATEIELSDGGSVIDGSGAYIYEGNLCIAYGGHYILTGELTNGSVIIDADKSDKIWILLNGVAVHAEEDAAIRIEQADKVFLTLAEGTENRLSSGVQYREDSADTGVDGVIYSRDDLTINGSGSLTVSADYEHGIVCNDDLVIAGGDIRISAEQDGIHANDSVRIRDTVISVSAGDDGITVSNDDETAFLYVESGDISVAECYEGLEAAEITIAGGKIDIMSTDDGINAGGSGENSVIRITGGDVRIVNSGGRDADGLDSNGSIYMEGGRLFISVVGDGGNCALDYGTENGGECVVSGGTVIACGGSAMAEGFDATSPQGFIMYNTSAEAGTTISLKDADGKELLREAIPYSFSSVVLSAPELAVGDVCTLVINDEEEQITIDNVQASGFAPAGGFGGGMRGGRGRGGMPGFQGAADEQAVRGPKDAEGLQGEELPGRMKPPGGEEFSERMERAGGEEFPKRMERFDGGRFQSSSSGIATATLALTGISVLVLLLGLLFAAKIKH